MHALVQLATCRWLQSEGSLEDWKHQRVLNLRSCIPTKTGVSFTKLDNQAWGFLRPHLRSAAQQRPKHRSSQDRWALLLFRAAKLAFSAGSLSDADMLITRAVDTYEDLYGLDDDCRMNCMSGLTMIRLKQARFAEAKAVQLQITRYHRKNYPDELEVIMECNDKLALYYQHLDELDEAIQLLEESTDTRREVRGRKSSAYLASLSNLTTALFQKGRYTDAGLAFEEVYQGFQELYGSSDIQTLTV